MAYDRLRNSGLMQALSDQLADLAELLRKELQLAKTELTEKIVSLVEGTTVYDPQERISGVSRD
jgi:hypothetical protein